MRRAKKTVGYSVTLIFIGLRDIELSSHRVAERVARGGHDVLPQFLSASYPGSLENLRAALEEPGLVDRLCVYDNSGTGHRLLLLVENGVIKRSSVSLPSWLETALPPRYLDSLRSRTRGSSRGRRGMSP
jgi:predicted ABC-type ATPase